MVNESQTFYSSFTTSKTSYALLEMFTQFVAVKAMIWWNNKGTVFQKHCVLYVCVSDDTAASLGIGARGGADRPRWHPPECDTRTKKMWVNLQRIVDKRVRRGKKVLGDTLQGGDTLVKSTKVTVMIKQRFSVFPETINRGDTACCRTDRRWWLNRSSVF